MVNMTTVVYSDGYHSDVHYGDGNHGGVYSRPEWDDVICRKLQPFICQLPAQVSAFTAVSFEC